MKGYIAVVGERCPLSATEILLSQKEIDSVVTLPSDPLLPMPICDHPDSLISIVDNRLYAHDAYCQRAKKELSFIEKKCGIEICPTAADRGREYPLDCGFNTLYLTDRHILIGRRKSLAEPLKKLCSINTNQGYAGCCALYAKGTVITADPSIEKSAALYGIPTYRISGEEILLEGYNEGFIGGAGGVFSDTVCLFGSPAHSKSAAEVEFFCKSNSMQLLCLDDGPLSDRGGVKFLEIRE